MNNSVDLDFEIWRRRWPRRLRMNREQMFCEIWGIFRRFFRFRGEGFVIKSWLRYSALTLRFISSFPPFVPPQFSSLRLHAITATHEYNTLCGTVQYRLIEEKKPSTVFLPLLESHTPIDMTFMTSIRLEKKNRIQQFVPSLDRSEGRVLKTRKKK